MPKIFGWIWPEEYACIELLGVSVPQFGTVVEVGSLLGLSAYAWSKNAPSSATIYCIDPWEEGGGFEVLANSFQQRYSRDQFLANTAGCNNIVALRGYSPKDFEDWNRPVDLYFEDAVHTDPTLGRNIQFWRRHLKPEGTISGHDYWPGYPDVVAWVERLSGELQRTIRGVRSVWGLVPDTIDPAILAEMRAIPGYFEGPQPGRRSGKTLPEPETPEFDEVVPALLRQAEAIPLAPVTVDIEEIEYSRDLGRELGVRGHFVLGGERNVPTVIDGYQCLAFGVRLKDSASQRLLAEGRSFLGSAQLNPAQRQRFDFTLSLPLSEPANVRLEIGLVYERLYWWWDRGITPKIVDLAVDPDSRRVTSIW